MRCWTSGKTGFGNPSRFPADFQKNRKFGEIVEMARKFLVTAANFLEGSKLFSFFLKFPEFYTCLIALCYLQVHMPTLDAMLSVKEQWQASEQLRVARPNFSELRIHWTRPFPTFHQLHAKQPHQSWTMLSSRVPEPADACHAFAPLLCCTLARLLPPIFVIECYWSILVVDLIGTFKNEHSSRLET